MIIKKNKKIIRIKIGADSNYPKDFAGNHVQAVRACLDNRARTLQVNSEQDTPAQMGNRGVHTSDAAPWNWPSGGDPKKKQVWKGCY